MEKILDFENVIVTIKSDENAENPRSWDNLGTCIFFHKRYNFGDKHELDANDFSNWAEQEKALVKDFGAVVFLPVYMYEHSGITIKTTPFGDPWDSGRLGTIIATRKSILERYGVKRISPKLKKRVTAVLQGEINTLDNYLTGEVYGFTVEDKETGDEIDSCWGFYGDGADNGIYDQLAVDGIDKEVYTKAFNAARWE